MSASVRIEDEAFGDLRFDSLARECGLADADHARGKMARIWRQCTERGVHVLSAGEVVAVLGERGPTALVESQLGQLAKGGIRIRGTRGRVEWLARLRKSAKKGGEANRAKWLAKGEPSGYPSGYPSGSRLAGAKREPKPSPLTLTLTPTLTDPERDQNPPIPPGPEIGPSAISHAHPSGALSRPLCLSSGKSTHRKCSPEDRETVERVLAQLTRRSGVRYRASDNHVRLILGRLADGISEHDLRCIAAYVWHKSGLGWGEAVNGQGVPMRRVYRPETLYGPQTIDRYLDAARAWYETIVEPSLTDEERQESAPSAPPNGVNGHRVRPHLGKG